MANDRDYIIRKARVEDCKEIYQMIYHVAFSQKMEDQVTITVSQLEKDGFCDAPKYYAFVAECEKTQKLIGYALFYYFYSSWKGHGGYLETIYVEEKWRKKGIGTHLIKSVMAEISKAGGAQCRFVCLGWNKGPLRLYKSLGAKDLTEIEDWHMLRFDSKEIHEMAM